jgi:thioredoxin reductase (NADPH)
MDYEVIIVGGGPAGLSAAGELSGAGRRVLVLDRESFGGQVGRLEWIENYPGPGERVEGPGLANALIEQAGGVKMELGEVVEIESYSGCRSVTCADGKAYTAPVVIVAGGLHPRPLGIPGEEKFQGKGMIHCAFCDGGLYTGKTVAVCGGGDAGLMEALYLSRFAAQVHVIEAQPQLSAAAELQARARGNPKLDIRTGYRPVFIDGDEFVTAIAIQSSTGGAVEKLEVYGILVHAGFDPVTGYLEGMVGLNEQALVEVNGDLQTDAEGVLAAGDIRAGSPRGVAAAVSDGRAAAATALRLLG